MFLWSTPVQLSEIIEIEFVGAAQRHRHAMHDHRVVLADCIEVVKRLATVDHVVLADDFEPVDVLRLAFENVLVVLRAQPQAEAEKGFIRL